MESAKAEYVVDRVDAEGYEPESSYAVYTLDDHGLVKEAQGFLPHEEAEALEAAGLSE